MKNWKWIVVTGGLGLIVVKALVINPLIGKEPDEDTAQEVIATDQNGRWVSVNEMLQWKPEVDIGK
jgi:hypothetical protein